METQISASVEAALKSAGVRLFSDLFDFNEDGQIDTQALLEVRRSALAVLEGGDGAAKLTILSEQLEAAQYVCSVLTGSFERLPDLITSASRTDLTVARDNSLDTTVELFATIETDRLYPVIFAHSAIFLGDPPAPGPEKPALPIELIPGWMALTDIGVRDVSISLDANLKYDFTKKKFATSEIIIDAEFVIEIEFEIDLGPLGKKKHKFLKKVKFTYEYNHSTGKGKFEWNWEDVK